MRFMPALCLALLLAACTNKFEKYYTPHGDVAAARLAPYSGSTEILRTSNPPRDYDRMHREGYLPLGHSYFNSNELAEYDLMAQARSVGADRVVLYQGHTRTIGGDMPVRQVTKQHPEGRAAGSVGWSVDYYNYRVTFWRRARPAR